LVALSKTTYSFGAVLRALGALYEAQSDAQRATLKARINHLQKLEVIGVSPGKGRALQYQMEHIWRWVFCLELAEFGISPAASATLVATYWKSAVVGIFRRAQNAVDSPGSPIFLYIRGAGLMSAAWRPKHRFADVPHIGQFTAEDANIVLNWLKDDQERVAPRISVVNLSARLRVLLAELKKHEQFAS
jgi:hypothetical protein